MTEVQQVLSQAQRIEHHHPWGRVIWHVWGAHQNKPPLVLLHGGSGSWTHWVRNVLHLSRTREVWALDIPGFGDSDLPAGVRDADQLPPYLESIFQLAFADQAVDVIGFSFGGMTAGLTAAAYPQRFRQLMLVAPAGLGLFGPRLALRATTADMNDSQRREVHRYNLSLMMLHDVGLIRDEVVDLQIQNVARDRLRRRRIAATDVLVGVQHQWQCPVHGIWGENDALYRGTLPQVNEVLTRLDSFQLIADAGHWVMYENAQAFHHLVDSWLV